MGPTWVLLAQGGPHVGPMNHAVGGALSGSWHGWQWVIDFLYIIPRLIIQTCLLEWKSPSFPSSLLTPIWHFYKVSNMNYLLVLVLDRSSTGYSTLKELCIQFVHCFAPLLFHTKMPAILQTKFSSTFSWMKMLVFQLRFHWSLFLSVQLTIF